MRLRTGEATKPDTRVSPLRSHMIERAFFLPGRCLKASAAFDQWPTARSASCFKRSTNRLAPTSPAVWPPGKAQAAGLPAGGPALAGALRKSLRL